MYILLISSVDPEAQLGGAELAPADTFSGRHICEIFFIGKEVRDEGRVGRWCERDESVGV